MRSQRPHYCPETVKVFDRVFSFASTSDYIVQPKRGTISDPPNPPPTKKLVVYEIRDCTTYVRVENTKQRQSRFLEARGPWVATLQDDYTHISGASAHTVKNAVELLNLELGLINDLLESVKCQKQC